MSDIPVNHHPASATSQDHGGAFTRRDVLGAAATAAAALGVAGAGNLLGSSPAMAAPVMDPTKVHVGYHVWAYQPSLPAVVAGVHSMRPTMVRWKLEWDRVQRSPAPVDWSPYRPFLRAMAAVRAVLYVQPWVQYEVPGWAKASGNANFPRSGTYEAFLDSLAGVLAEEGCPAIWGTWNEPDLRSGLADVNGRWNFNGQLKENYPWPWYMTWWDPFRGSAFWTGGLGWRYSRLFYQGTRTYTSNGVTKKAWIKATAPLADLIDLHPYLWGRSIEQYVDGVGNDLAKWDATRPGLPFILGEAGSWSRVPVPEYGLTVDKEDERLRAIHEATAAAFPGRYRGLLALGLASEPERSQGWWDG